MSVSVRKDNVSIMETVTKYGAFSFKLLPDNIAVITIDVEGERVNTLKAEFIGQIEALLLHAQQQQLQGMVLVSAKPGSFIAGADITMLDACTSAQQASELAQQGQRIFSRIAALPIPVVAAIEGACLGGGLELALACHYRICADDDKTVLGLPEVQLGLLPGSGGTQRLPSLIGIPKTLELILSGRQVKGKEALRIGLVDEVVPAVILLEAAIACIRQGQSRRFVRSWQDRLLQSALGRAVLWRGVAKKTHKKTLGNYPATNKIIEVIRCGVEQGSAKGYEAEAKAFGELVMTPQSEALRSLFFATNGLKKELGVETDSISLRNVGVLGGGLMGGGIAYVTAIRAGLSVRIKDVSQQGINHALGYSWEILSKRVKARRMRPAERQRQMQRLSGTLNYSGFAKADVVIEAVFEDLSLKQQMVAEVEAHGAAHTVFASNTSSLPIAQIAAKARYPERVVGLHYFSPVDKMPLVEVIPHQGSSESSIATILALAQRQGKTAIVVADRPGFYVNRILTPYMAEAARCLLEGAKIDVIDHALLQAGFPVGPFGLLDEVGIDVGTKIIPILVEEFGERFSVPAVFDTLLQDNRKGRKNGRGFYCYSKKWFQCGKKSVDDSVYQLLGIKVQSSVDAKLIAERCMMLMLNEAARCLAEGVICCARDGDIGAVFGIGFPPFFGGPFRYMDRLGIDHLVQRLNVLQQRYGAHFAPSEVLLKMQQQGQRFYPLVS